MPLDPTIWNPALTGPAGADGRTIHTVSGAPSDSIGEDFDYAIDPVAWVIYGPKSAGVWPAGTTLIGPAGADGAMGLTGAKGAKGDTGNTGAAGADGATIHAGLIAPTLDIGAVGDYYLNLTTTEFYGPKIAGSWGVPIVLKGADGVVVDAAYGQLICTQNSTTIAVTAASPTDLTDNADYIQVVGVWDAIPHGLNNLFTQTTNGMICNKSGVYMVHFWASMTSDTNGTNIAFKFAVDGVISPARRPWRLIRNATEIHSLGAFGFVELTAGQEVTLWVASDKTAALTITDSIFALVEMEATGRYTKVFDEAVELTPDLMELVFTGAGATASLTGPGKVTVDIPGGITGIDVQEEGVSVGTFDSINFVGTAVTVVENPAGVAEVTVTSGGGGGGGTGKLTALPVGTRIFEDHIAAWSAGQFGTSGRIYMWVTSIDEELTISGIEYGVVGGLTSAGASIYFEIHEILGHGLPGPCIASAALDVSTAAMGKTVTFGSPITIPAGYYLASICVDAEGSAAPGLPVMTTLTAAANPRKAALMITDYWTWLNSTSEMNVVYFSETHLPGGNFVANSDWTGTSLQFAEVTQYTAIPHIGLIKG